MKAPCLLTLTELIAPVNRTQDKLDAITRAHVDIAAFAQSRSDRTLAAIANEGIFVLLMSTFEVMLSDVLMCYLQNFPDKLEFKDSPFTTEQVVGATLTNDLWEIKAESLVRSRMYKDMSVVMNYFLATLSIGNCPLDPDQLDKLTEMKLTRNLLMHADCVVNATYLDKAGAASRAGGAGERLSIDGAYLGDCLVTLKYFLVEVERRIGNC